MRSNKEVGFDLLVGGIESFAAERGTRFEVVCTPVRCL